MSDSLTQHLQSEIVKAGELADRLAVQLRAAEKDAERYRWMRRNAYFNSAGELCINADNAGRPRLKTVADLDAAIDAELASERGKS